MFPVSAIGILNAWRGNISVLLIAVMCRFSSLKKCIMPPMYPPVWVAFNSVDVAVYGYIALTVASIRKGMLKKD